MKPFSIPNVSWMTLATGARQFVVPRSVREDVMLRRIISLVVDAQDQGDVRVGGPGADDDFFAPPGSMCLRRSGRLGPFARGFPPRCRPPGPSRGGGRALPSRRGHLELSCRPRGRWRRLDREVMIEESETRNRISRKMGQRRRVGDVVHRQEFDLGVVFGGAQEIPADCARSR